jgi:hypothetical protein
MLNKDQINIRENQIKRYDSSEVPAPFRFGARFKKLGLRMSFLWEG